MNYVFSSIVGAGLVPTLSTTGNHENQGNHKGLPLQTDKQSNTQQPRRVTPTEIT